MGPEGDSGEPPPPPLPPSPLSRPQPKDGRWPASATAAPLPPCRARRDPPPTRGPRHPGRDVTGPVRRAPPVRRPPNPTRTAAGQQPCAVAKEYPTDRIPAAARGRQPVQYGGHALQGQGNDRAACFDARPWEAEGQTEAERPPAPRPAGPPGQAREGGRRTDRHPSDQPDPPAASQTAPGARGYQTPPTEHAAGWDARRNAAGHWGGQEPGATGQPPAAAQGPGRGTGGGWRGNTARQPPPTLPPTPPPPAHGILEAGQGGADPLPPETPGEPRKESRRTWGGERRWARTPHAPTPSPACLQSDHDRQADPHQRTMAPDRAHPGSARGHEPEQYGGHALNELSDADDTPFGARPGKAEGRTKVERPPAPRAPPATPPGSTAHRPPPPPPRRRNPEDAGTRSQRGTQPQARQEGNRGGRPVCRPPSHVPREGGIQSAPPRTPQCWTAPCAQDCPQGGTRPKARHGGKWTGPPPSPASKPNGARE